jgi:MFS family permease
MKTKLARWRPLISNPDFLLLLLISINLIVGAATAADYGESWDEQPRYQYAEESLAAYSGDVGDLKDEKGSFYVMAAKLGSEVLGFLRKDWQPIEAWHYMNFLTFQLGLFFLYRLAGRVIGKWAAFATVLLFATQPLLWGHAFINPKDIPFMVFFLGSVEFGLSMADVHTQIRSFLNSILHSFATRHVWIAGAFLGFASSIRVLGPLSGLLVAGYFLLRRGRKALPVLGTYLVVGMVTTYLTWPNLWGSPLSRYLKSLAQASDFSWDGTVMFAGVVYAVGQLPRLYLPVLLSIQFSEVALVLFVIGLAAALIRFTRGTLDRRMIMLLAAWGFLPLLAAIILQPTMYDNFRHFLFIIPPFFIFAGVGIQAIFNRIHARLWKSLLVGLMILPNIWAMARLHPYEYVYYNQLVGGVRGAFRHFEMDYWATSYREATDYVNAIAPSRARIAVWGPYTLVASYARNDLEIERLHGKIDKGSDLPNLAILSTRENEDQTLFPSDQTIFSVGRDGAIFVVIKIIH